MQGPPCGWSLHGWGLTYFWFRELRMLWILRFTYMGNPCLHRCVCMLYVHTMLPKNEWIISNIAVEVEFTDELGLDLIMNYSSTRDF